MARTAAAKGAAANAPAARPTRQKQAPVSKATSAAKAEKVEKAVKAVKAVKADAKPAPKAKAEAEQKEKQKKPKLVRDSFTMPEAEYAVLGEVKKACLKAGIEVKKSELLRVGVALLRRLDTAQLKEILAGLPALKAGRPKKSK